MAGGLLLGQVQQSVACNVLHTMEARLCRWLLQARDCMDGNDIPLTQEFLGQMLGVRRTTVTLAAQLLQSAGLIRYRRGHIQKRQQGQQGQTGQPPQGRAEQGQSGGGSTVNLTTEQRTRIRETVLVGGNAPRASNVNFAISVDTAVPTNVRVVEVPAPLIELHPEWRGHMYFVVGDEIIIVDRNHRIIAVIAV